MKLSIKQLNFLNKVKKNQQNHQKNHHQNNNNKTTIKEASKVKLETILESKKSC